MLVKELCRLDSGVNLHIFTDGQMNGTCYQMIVCKFTAA